MKKKKSESLVINWGLIEGEGIYDEIMIMVHEHRVIKFAKFEVSF